MSDAKPGNTRIRELRDLLASDFPGAWGVDPVSNHSNVSVLRSTNLDDDGHIHYSSGARRYFGPRDLARKQLVIGDILLEASGGGPGKPVGRVALFKPPSGQIYACSNFFRTLRPTVDVDSGYLAWYLQWIYRQPSIWQFQQQTTGIINLKYKDYLRQSIMLPDVSEQRSIAQILDAADDAIRSTERLIAKFEQTKQGLLHDLLTRGADSSGRLRADRHRAPSLYRDSRLGRIPADWTVRLLDEVSVRGSGHTPSKNIPAYWNGGIKWVSLADSARLDKIYITETDKEISDLGIANSSAVMHRAGTVILSRDAGIGKSAILAHEMAVSQHFMAWSCGESLDSHYLYYWLQFMKPRFEAIAMGSTIKTIGLPFFRKLSIPLPPIDQQRVAAGQLLAADEVMVRHCVELEKQRLMKQGLMNDLLTGRVRVGAS